MKRKLKAWPFGLLAVALAGAWHLWETGKGAAGSGDLWLTDAYLVLAAILLAGLGILGRWFFAGRLLPACGGKNGGKNGIKIDGRIGGKAGAASLERIYLPAGLLFGLAFLFVLPPLSAPDEISHYVSAYQLSNRILGQQACARSGRVLVRAEDAWVEDLEGIGVYEADEDGHLEVVPGSNEGSTVLGEYLDESVYETLHELGFTGRYDPARTESLAGGGVAGGTGGAGGGNPPAVASANPPVVTTPLAYVPQALGITAARLLGLNTVALLVLGRLANLLFFVGMTFLAMRLLPFGKEVLFGVALLPMTLHLSASCSYDVMILACVFVFTALCLDLAYRRERVRAVDVAALAALAAAFGPCKMVYAVMFGLCLLIPVKKFGGWLRWGLSAAAVALAWAVAMYLVNSQVIVSYTGVAEPYVPWADEAGYSLTLLWHQPWRLFKMFYQTLLWQGEQFHLTMVGSALGNLDPVLDVPYLAVVLYTLGLLGLALRKPGESLELSGGRRAWVILVCAGCAAAAMGSMLIAWTPLSARVIQGVQGRYFLPFLPVLLMAVKNNTVVLTKDSNRSILYIMCCLDAYALLRLFSVVSMRL